MIRSSTRRFTGGDLLMKQLNVNPPVQLLWRIDQQLDVRLLEGIHENLVNGPLNRMMHGARIPLARPVWLPHHRGRAMRILDDELPAEGVMDWADGACATELNAHEGRGWELSAANVTGGTSLVSLVCSHALTDGQGLIAAVTLAARNACRQQRGGSIRPSLAGDLADVVTGGARAYGRIALARWKADTTGRGSVGALRGLLNRRRQGGTGSEGSSGGRPPVRSRVTVTVAADELDRAAGSSGGSTTGLMLAITANTLRAARSTATDTPFTVALPVSFRRPDDLESSNMVGMAAVRLDARSGRYTDLQDIRKRSKAAYAGVTYGRHLTGYPQSDAALSNAGETPPETKNAFGPARAVLCRTVSGGGGAPGRMNCFVLKAEDAVSLGFQSSGVSVSRTLVSNELAAWGITTTGWW